MSENTPTPPESAGGSLFTGPALRQFAWNILGPLVGLICVVLFFSITDLALSDGTFSTTGNARLVVVQTCAVAVAALGMTVIIIAGGIDLSAGTALALSATTLAWGIKEDVAFLVTHGSNFDRASQNLRLAQEQYDELKGNAASAEEVKNAEAVVEQRREQLLSLAEIKLAAAKQLAESAPEEKQRLLRRNVGLIEDKIEKIKNPEFRLNPDPNWRKGVPNSGFSAALAVLIGVLTGICTGIVNGVLISYLRMTPFIVTLGTMTIFVGVGNLITGNTPIHPSLAQVPEWLELFISPNPDGLVLGFPIGVWFAFVCAVALSLVLRLTVFGRYVFAIGSNESTARLCGVNVLSYKVAMYALGGFFIGVAGAYQFAKLTTGDPMEGIGLELQIIAAVVIGGGSLNGGRGTVIGTIAGAGIMAVIASGCTHLEVADQVQRIILGAVIIGAVLIDKLRQNKRGAA